MDDDDYVLHAFLFFLFLFDVEREKEYNRFLCNTEESEERHNDRLSF